MFQHSSISRHIFQTTALLACLAVLPAGAAELTEAEQPGCCLTEAARSFGFEASEPGPFLDLSGDAVFQSSSDLQADGAHWITVSNPYSDRSIAVQVRAITDQVKARSIAVELAAGDSASFDLQPGAIQLLATSTDSFQVQVEDLNSGALMSPEVKAARTGRNPRTNEPLAAAKSMTTHCQGDWTLTCASSGCSGLGPFTHEGRVDRFTVWVGNRPLHTHNVYWNLNTPNGNYKTINHQGLTATWGPGPGICPVTVTNSLGHTYTVATP